MSVTSSKVLADLLTPSQFLAISVLLRLRSGPALVACHHHFVLGHSVPVSAQLAGIRYPLAVKAVYRFEKGLALVRKALGKKDGP